MGLPVRGNVPDTVLISRAQNGREWIARIPVGPDFVSGNSGPGYQVDLDLSPGYPDGLVREATPDYTEGQRPDEADLINPTRTWILRWTPTPEECRSDIHPFQKIWTFSATLRSRENNQAAPSYNFAITAELRTLRQRVIRGSEVNGPPESRYGVREHFPLPWYKVNPATGILDAEAAIAVQYLYPPSIGTRTFDFAQESDAQNRQVFNLENGDLVSETFTGELESAIPEQSVYLIRDIDLYLDFTGDTMPWKRIHFTEPPDVSRELRAVSLGINIFGVALGNSIAYGDENLLVPILPVAGNRGNVQIYEVLLNERELGSRLIARGHGVVGAFSLMQDNRFWWNSDRAGGLRFYSMSGIDDGPGTGGRPRTHNVQNAAAAAGQTQIRRDAQNISDRGVFTSLASNGTTGWGIANHHQSFVSAAVAGTWRDAITGEPEVEIDRGSRSTSAVYMLVSRGLGLVPGSPPDWGTRWALSNTARFWPASNTLVNPAGTGARLFVRVPIADIGNLANYRFAIGTRTFPSSSWTRITQADVDADPTAGPANVTLPTDYAYYYLSAPTAAGEAMRVQVLAGGSPEVWADEEPRIYDLDLTSGIVYEELGQPLGLDNPQASAWYRDRLIVANVVRNDTNLHVVNPYAGDAFPTTARTLTGRIITGLTVGFGGVLISNSNGRIDRIAPFAAEIEAPGSPAAIRQGSATQSTTTLTIENLPGYAYELRMAGDNPDTLYSAHAPLAEGGYLNWAPVHANKTDTATQVTFNHDSFNEPFSVQLRRVFLPNNADTDEGIPGEPGPVYNFRSGAGTPIIRQTSSTSSTWNIQVNVPGNNENIRLEYYIARTEALVRSGVAADTLTSVVITDGTASGEFTRLNPQAGYDSESWIMVRAYNFREPTAAGALSEPFRLRSAIARPNYVQNFPTGSINGHIYVYPHMQIWWENPDPVRFPNAVLEVALMSYSDVQARSHVIGSNPIKRNPALTPNSRYGNLPTYNDVVRAISGTMLYDHAGQTVVNRRRSLISATGNEPWFICSRMRESRAADANTSAWTVVPFYSDLSERGVPTASVDRSGYNAEDRPDGAVSVSAQYVWGYEAQMDYQLAFSDGGTFTDTNDVRSFPAWPISLFPGDASPFGSPRNTIEPASLRSRGWQFRARFRYRGVLPLMQRPDASDPLIPTTGIRDWSPWSGWSSGVNLRT